MKNLFRFTLTAFCALFAISPASAAAASKKRANFEIVESIPLETSLGSTRTAKTLETWLDMLGKAEKTLDIEAFYFSSEPGQPMEKVLAAIKNAASRGVKTRIIVDQSFYKHEGKSVDSLKGIPAFTSGKSFLESWPGE